MKKAKKTTMRPARKSKPATLADEAVRLQQSVHGHMVTVLGLLKWLRERSTEKGFTIEPAQANAAFDFALQMLDDAKHRSKRLGGAVQELWQYVP